MSREDDQRAAADGRVHRAVSALTAMAEHMHPDDAVQARTVLHEVARLRAELAETRAVGDALAKGLTTWLTQGPDGPMGKTMLCPLVDMWNEARGSVLAPDRAGDAPTQGRADERAGGGHTAGQDEGQGDAEVWIPPTDDCMDTRHDPPCPHCSSTVFHWRTGRCGVCGRRPAAPAVDTAPAADEVLLVRLDGRKGGQVTVGHSRLPVTTVLRALGRDGTVATARAAYPDLTEEQGRVLAALRDELGAPADGTAAPDERSLYEMQVPPPPPAHVTAVQPTRWSDGPWRRSGDEWVRGRERRTWAGLMWMYNSPGRGVEPAQAGSVSPDQDGDTRG